ncbi:maleylpyruvate isomerase N-terminal domain-containing protein [Dactylosporangium sp. NPDC051484]|uniref:maleylpyruvate isomerase N-terminal domain-containing protein n=1 Tax=Dactylosporangium sp. NPDC051484 TaxID=3154942 RepID=UPI00344F3E33
MTVASAYGEFPAEDGNRVLSALRDEADAFVAALGGLSTQDWERPTRCVPWQVRDVVGHVITVLARVPEMVAAPAPDQPDTTATSYYRADHRFSESANADRVRTAHRRATAVEAVALLHDLTRTVQAVITSCRQEPTARVVRTRHDDAMSLSDFLTTRVVELTAHGLDVADAVGHQPWLTVPAAEHLQELLFGPDWRTAVAALGWDPVMLLRKTTGRAAVTAEESMELARLGLRGLTLG